MEFATPLRLCLLPTYSFRRQFITFLSSLLTFPHFQDEVHFNALLPYITNIKLCLYSLYVAVVISLHKHVLCTFS